jgi:hypothetical protein
MLLVVSIVKKGWIVMKTILLCFSLAVYALAPSSSIAQLTIVNHKPYADRFSRGPMRPYTYRISAEVQAPCDASFFLRSANDIYPGDYFWPAFAGTPPAILSYPNYLIKNPSSEEKQQIALFLKDYFPMRFQNPALIDSAQAYTLRCLYTPDSVRHEFYIMLSEGDTIYVISGWDGKFISFFRANPYDKKLTPTDFIAQAIQIAPGLGKLALSDQMVKVDTGKVWEEKTYFLQSYEISNRLWLRHYPISVVLPPDNPETGKEKLYNLIEISKIYDQALFDGRLNQVLYRR